MIGNNIANVNTTAFKGARVDLADSFSQTIGGSAVGPAGSMHIGYGVTTAAITNLYSQAAFSRTGSPTDLAVAGDGFFVDRDPLSDTTFVTRAGDFRRDDTGFLVTTQGMRVQGFTDGTLTTRGDLKIDATGSASATATMVSFGIGQDGKMTVNMSDGSSFTRGQVLLQTFTNPNALVKEGNNLYSGIGSAGPLGGSATPVSQAPGSNGLGKVQAGALELSNVDLANEFTNLITTQRAYQANARVITTSDEMLQELVNLKR